MSQDRAASQLAISKKPIDKHHTALSCHEWLKSSTAGELLISDIADNKLS